MSKAIIPHGKNWKERFNKLFDEFLKEDEYIISDKKIEEITEKALEIARNKKKNRELKI